MFLSGTNRVLGSGRCSLDSLNMKQFTWLSGLVLLVWSVCKAILYSTICRTSLHSRAQAVFWAEGYHEFSYFTYMMYYYCYPPSPLEPPRPRTSLALSAGDSLQLDPEEAFHLWLWCRSLSFYKNTKSPVNSLITKRSASSLNCNW